MSSHDLRINDGTGFVVVTVTSVDADAVADEVRDVLTDEFEVVEQ